MTNPLHDRHIILGVTGSIAAYKAVEIASRLHQNGAFVDVIMTESATRLVTPLTFQSVCARRAYCDQDLWGSEGHVVHISLARATELLVIAPASANTIAKLAHGIADNLLTVTALASQSPMLIAPAMDAGMYGHPATQENIAVLKHRGVVFIGPVAGHLASDLQGVGRMVEASEIYSRIRYLCSGNGELRGRKIVITAGGTQEAIDPVRIITNRSSGKQGYALAQAALDAGADVMLITTPTGNILPHGASIRYVKSAQEMLEAVIVETADAACLIMAAAVADFRPKVSQAQKIKKQGDLPVIHLERTVDILAKIAEIKERTGMPLFTIGFAAESEDLIKNAAEKLRRKNLDMIVANNILAKDAGFEVDTNQVSFLYRDRQAIEHPLLSKAEVAERILQQVKQWLPEKK